MVCHEEYEAKDSVEVEWFMLTGVAQEWSLVRGGEGGVISKQEGGQWPVTAPGILSSIA